MSRTRRELFRLLTGRKTLGKAIAERVSELPQLKPIVDLLQPKLTADQAGRALGLKTTGGLSAMVKQAARRLMEAEPAKPSPQSTQHPHPEQEEPTRTS